MTELPEFLNFAKSFEGDSVKFLLIAVNDKEQDLKKYLKRFENIPQNVTIAMDPDGKSMDFFGSSKVPETYLFDRSKAFVNKFIGPQDWKLENFQTLSKKRLGI